MTRQPPPASIHDPITPEQAQYLPAFYWNVQPRTLMSAVERQRQRNNDCAKARYRRLLEERQALSDTAAWADVKVGKLTDVGNHNRAAYVMRPAVRRAEA